MGSNGTVTVDGAGSTWTSNGTTLYVGQQGNGTLNISNGGAVLAAAPRPTSVSTTFPTVAVAFGGISRGTLTVKSLYAAPSQLSGTGTIVTNGLVSDVNLVFNSEASKTQTVVMPGSSVGVRLAMSTPATVGDLGAGYLSSSSVRRISRSSVPGSSSEVGCVLPIVYRWKYGAFRPMLSRPPEKLLSGSVRRRGAGCPA